MAKSYGAESIQWLKGAAGIQANPTYYLGETGSNAVRQMGIEVLGNSIDEAASGHGDTIVIQFDADNTLTIFDWGRGIPVGKHPKHPEHDVLTLLFTELHTGGKKANQDGYDAGTVGCFTGDTRVKLLDGTSPTFEDLYNKWQKKKKKFWVFSHAHGSGRVFNPRQAYHVQLSKYVTKLAHVTLDDGSVIKCTVDHPFMTFDGEYVEAQHLEVGQSLKALYFGKDKDGYITHNKSLFVKKKTASFKKMNGRVHRTVQSFFENIEGKSVHHKNKKIWDNRPNNLKSMNSVRQHFHQDNYDYGQTPFHARTKKNRITSSQNMAKVNSNPRNGFSAQEGKIVQCAARALLETNMLTEATYTKFRGWCYPHWDLALEYFTEKSLFNEARAYIKRYGKEGRYTNGGLGLHYKLLSAYKKNPVDNINGKPTKTRLKYKKQYRKERNEEARINHTVASIKIVNLREAVPVYGMSVEGEHNYLLDAGVFVANTHGVGLTVVNALSKKLQVWTNAKSRPYTQIFEKGAPRGKPVAVDKVPRYKGIARVPGTVVRFTVDTSFFDRGVKLDYKALLEWIREASWFAYCNKFKGSKLVDRQHIKFIVIDPNGKEIVIQRKGLEAYFNTMKEALKAERVALDKPFVVNTPSCDIVLGWTSHDEEHIKAYTNSVVNILGGTHHKAFLKLIDTVFRKYAKAKQNYKIADLLVGAIGCVNVRIKAPKFDSQGKSRLASVEAAEYIEKQVGPLMETWARKNKKAVLELIERAVTLNSLTSKLKDDKKLAAALKVKKGGKMLLPSKMLVSHTKKHEDRELFLVEGDSAKGSCATASNRLFQEILPLRGKLPNMMRTEKKKGGKATEVNPTIVDILKATGITPKDGTSKMRVGKVMLLMDADSDGPLSGDTKVHLVDGSARTMKELYDSNDEEEMYVWADVNGKFQPAQVSHVTRVATEKHLLIKLDDGTKLRMTHNHRQFIKIGENVKEVKGRDLKVGDRIPCMYLVSKEADGYTQGNYLCTTRYYQPHAEQIVKSRGQVRHTDNYGKPITADDRLHRIAAKYFFPEEYAKYRRNNKRAKHKRDLIHIHHEDECPSNNMDYNLAFVTMSEHGKRHSDTLSVRYNGTKKHLRAIAKTNANPEHNATRLLGRCARYYLALLDKYGRVNNKIWDDNLKFNGITIPFSTNLKHTPKEIMSYARKYLSGQSFSLQSEKETRERYAEATHNRNMNWYKNTVADLQNSGLRCDRRGLEKLRKINKKSGRRTLSWKRFSEFNSRYNHKIVSIREVHTKQYFYCLTVPEAGNFYIHDRNGNALLTGNSHIASLLLGLLLKYAPDLFDKGKVFFVDTPLYTHKSPSGVKTYARDYASLQKKVGDKIKSGTITRAKGLGELNADILEDVAFNPKTRKLIKITPERARNRTAHIMGDDVIHRKELLGV